MSGYDIVYDIDTLTVEQVKFGLALHEVMSQARGSPLVDVCLCFEQDKSHGWA
jgi:hypothetical protein